MSATLPPDLRVLYRKLTSLPPAQLPQALPSLINHVIRCQKQLSTPQDPKAKGEAAESISMVRKLKTSITTLLNSRAREARLAAVVLIKTAVDVGGWEVLHGTEPWVRGLLSIVQKGDPFCVKEMAIVSLTRIFVLLQPYQTLVREVATPNIPAFATACMQLIKPLSPDRHTDTPLGLVETICDAFTKLIPLYPATFRPFSNQTAAAVRFFVAPTESDGATIPASLQQAARRLSASQHFVAAKSNGIEEWSRLVDSIIDELHNTADQVLRAVDESWEPAAGGPRPSVSLDQEPAGGSLQPDQLPAWSGMQSGAQRLAGLFNYIAVCLSHPTKGPINLPLTRITDAVTRVCLMARLSPRTQNWDQALQVKAAVGRDEKDELWSLLPDLHIAAMGLVQALFNKLDDTMLPYASESLDHLLRVLNSGIDISHLRSACYQTLNEILPVSGQTLSKSSVDMLQPAIGACCRDLQEDAGYLKQPKKLSATAAETKKNSLAANADLFLQKPDSSSAEVARNPLDTSHRTVASRLLVLLLSGIPQKHLKPSHRSLLDQTAILTRSREAMVASVLNPYIDSRGRRYASILPHLTQQFPNDRDPEILRTNLRSDGASNSNVESISEDEEDEEDDDEDNGDEDKEMAEADVDMPVVEAEADSELKPGIIPAAPQMDVPVQPRSNPFEISAEDKTATVYGELADVEMRGPASPPKRKHEEDSESLLSSKKRQETEQHRNAGISSTTTAGASGKAAEDEEDDDSDESVHLNMELEDDDDDDEE